MGELEKLYKKLQEQGHVDRKELAKLREELQVAKVGIRWSDKVCCVTDVVLIGAEFQVN